MSGFQFTWREQLFLLVGLFAFVIWIARLFMVPWRTGSRIEDGVVVRGVNVVNDPLPYVAPVPYRAPSDVGEVLKRKGKGR